MSLFRPETLSRRIEGVAAACYPALMTRAFSPRFAVTAVFAVFGVIGGLISGAIPTIAKSVRLDELQLGVAFTLLIFTNVAAMILAGRLARWLSVRKALLLSIPAIAFCASALLLSGHMVLTVVALAGLGASQGLTDVFMNAEGSNIETDLAKPIFSSLHASVSITVGIAAIAGSMLVVGIAPAAAIPIIVLSAVAGMALVWRATPYRIPSAQAVSTAQPELGSRWPLIFIGLAFGLENAGELAALFWSARLLDEAAPNLAAIAGIGPAFYAGCNALMRLRGDGLRARFGDRNVIIGSMLVAAAGFAGVGLVESFTLRVIAFAVVGFGTACFVPCLFAIVTNNAGTERASRLGFMAMLSGPPRIISPLLFGWIAQHASLGPAFGLCSVLMISALGLFLLSEAITVRPAVSQVS